MRMHTKLKYIQSVKFKSKRRETFTILRSVIRNYIIAQSCCDSSWYGDVAWMYGDGDAMVAGSGVITGLAATSATASVVVTIVGSAATSRTAAALVGGRAAVALNIDRRKALVPSVYGLPAAASDAAGRPLADSRGWPGLSKSWSHRSSRTRMWHCFCRSVWSPPSFLLMSTPPRRTTDMSPRMEMELTCWCCCLWRR